MLTVYHAVYSITIPILLVELVYTDQRDRPWISRRVFNSVFLLLTSVVVLGFILFTVLSGYSLPVLQYLVTVVTVIMFGYAAYQLPTAWGSGNTPLPNTWMLWIMGVIGTFAFFFGFWLMPSLIHSWSVGILVSLVLLVLATSSLKRYAWNTAMDKHRFALVSGALAFFIVFAPLQEFDATRTDNPLGMSLVGLSFVMGLMLLKRRVWMKSTQRKEAREPIQPEEPALKDSRTRGYCVHCGAKFPFIAVYCPQCGKTITRTQNRSVDKFFANR